MLLITCMLLSFIYGIVTVQYKIFPFEQIKLIAQTISSKMQLKHSDYFYHKKSFFEHHGDHPYDAVLIGDSLTDDAEWQDLFPSLRLANRGIDGDRTDGVHLDGDGYAIWKKIIRPYIF